MRVPIIPTILVLAAAATMVALGIWQLGRAEEKAALLESYDAVGADAAPVEFPFDSDEEGVLFRRSALDCARVTGSDPVAGTAANGAKGWAVRVTCVTAGGEEALVDLGFTRELSTPQWQGGTVTGIIASGPRLVADPPAADLYPLAKPDPNDLPNNHLSYAGQWFLFAATALIIYFVALRARTRSGSRKRA